MSDTIMRPRVFIGSSREGIQVASAIHSNLSYVAECTVWKDAFMLSGTTIGELMRNLRSSDFGIFVFSSDDVTTMRGTTNSSVRDNVLFELGMFIGRLGTDRCFFVIPDNATDLRLPSDLAGVTAGRYENSRRDGNWNAALTPVCASIEQRIKALRGFQDTYSSSSQTSPSPAPAPAPAPAFMSAKLYKKSVLIKSVPPEHKEAIKEIGASWNRTLTGWILPGKKQDQLKNLFPDLVIEPADPIANS